MSGLNAVSPENTFSQNSASGLPNPWYDIYLDQNSHLGNIAYVKDNANSNTNPWQSPQPPSVPNVSISGGQTKNCNVSNPFMITIGEILTDNGFGTSPYETVKQQYLNVEYLYSQLIDGGNSQSVESNIDYNWSNDAWQLHNELMNLSPNLSSEVLLHAASKDILPPALLYEVCSNNIRSSRSPQMLENLSSYLPAYMIDMLKNASEPGTYRKTLEEQLTNYRGQLTQAYQSVINFAIGDTVDRSSLMISLLQDVPLVDAKRQLIDVYLQKRDYANATLALNDYVSQLPSGTFATQTANFLGFIIQKAPDILNLSTQDINYLQTVAADSSHSYFIQAHNILRAKGLSDYWARPLSIPSSAHKNLVVSKNSENTPSNTLLNIYPNPAGDYITAEYQYFVPTNSLKVAISDYTGKVYKVINVTSNIESKNLSNINIHDLPSGTYILSLKNQEEVLKTQRFTKQ